MLGLLINLLVAEKSGFNPADNQDLAVPQEYRGQHDKGVRRVHEDVPPPVAAELVEATPVKNQ